MSGLKQPQKSEKQKSSTVNNSYQAINVEPLVRTADNLSRISHKLARPGLTLFLGFVLEKIFDFSSQVGLSESPTILYILVFFLLTVTLIALYFAENMYEFTKNRLSDYSNTMSVSLGKNSTDIADMRGLVDKTFTRLSQNPMTAEYFENDLTKKVDVGYSESEVEILKAKNRIWIIGDYSPKSFPLIPPPNRKEYLDSILRRIEQAYEDNQEDFEYVRIIQRDDSNYDKVMKSRVRGRYVELTLDLMAGDRQIYDHCKDVLDLRRKKTLELQEKHGNAFEVKPKVEVYIAPIIPNIPSLLLLDQDHILFTVPTIAENGEKSQNGEESHNYVVLTDGVLALRDHKKGEAFVKRFDNIVRKIRRSDMATLVLNVK